MYIKRSISDKIIYAHQYYPVILITGARQVGKSTLAQHLFPEYKYVNLEDTTAFFAAESDPKAFLDSLGKFVIIDEAQNCEKLISQIQFYVDSDPGRRYILTGSSNFVLMKTASQSLAGRLAVFVLPPLTFVELPDDLKNISTETLLYRGFYPGVVTGIRPVDLFYKNYYTTYIERDIRSTLKIGNLMRFDIFIRLMAGRIGSECNFSALATEVGVSAKTISEWVSVLEKSCIIFPLRPYFANISKRLTKQPKWYFHDTGLAAYLLGIEEPSQLISHPLRGALFENMAVAELMNRALNDNIEPNLFFYREKSGREVDVVKPSVNSIDVYEIKSAQTFHSDFTRNLEYFKSLFKNEKIATLVIYDGDSYAPIAVNVRDI